jgi:hypothetical protein
VNEDDPKSNLEDNTQRAQTNQDSQATGVLSRRFFLSKGLKSSGSFLLASGVATSPLLAKEASKSSKVNVNPLKDHFKFKGEVFTPADPDFKNAAYSGLARELA